VLVDADGKLGTMAVDANGNRMIVPLKGVNAPQAVPQRQTATPKGAKKQAMLEHKVEELQATVTRQQKQIEFLAAGLQKVSAQLELSKSAPQTVLNE
jgi:hypothetical protein